MIENLCKMTVCHMIGDYVLQSDFIAIHTDSVPGLRRSRRERNTGKDEGGQSG